MAESISINLSKVQGELSKVDSELKDLEDRMANIYRQALVNNMPAAEMVIRQLGATPKDCKMLSKVFDRLSVYLAQLEELQKQKAALSTLSHSQEWLYNTVGDMGRDMDLFLQDNPDFFQDQGIS